MSKTILIVDDSATARMLIRRCVEIAGLPDAEFLEAGNGIEGLEVMSNKSVSLVFTDLNMPEMDGSEFLRAIRASDSYASIPVIVITSAGNEAREAALRQEGATVILSKPISPAIIASTLDSLEETNNGD